MSPKGFASIAIVMIVTFRARLNAKLCGKALQADTSNIGLRLDGHLIVELGSSPDLQECARQCTAITHCLSFNFARELGLCQLNRANRSDADSIRFVTNGSFVYIDIASWLQWRTDACARKPCLGTDRCVSDGSSHLCLSTNCSEPPSTVNGASLVPGSLTIGSIRNYTCPNGTELQGTSHIMCNGSSWSVPQCTCEKVCPSDDWMTFGTHCYLFGSQNIVYNAARSFCDTFDNAVHESNLVQVDTVDELTFLKGVMETRTTKPDSGYWNDLFQVGTNGVERWRTSNDPLTVSDWFTYQPDDYNGLVQSCTAFWKAYEYEQVDINCANSVHTTETNHASCFAVCEISLDTNIR